MPSPTPAPARPGPDPDRQARLLAAVAEPTRLRIVLGLRGGPRTVGAIAAAVRATRVVASNHLRVLRLAGVVQDRRLGRHVEWRLHPDLFRPARRAGGRTWASPACAPPCPGEPPPAPVVFAGIADSSRLFRPARRGPGER